MKVKGLKLTRDEFVIEDLEWGTADDADTFDRLLKLFERMQEDSE